CAAGNGFEQQAVTKIGPGISLGPYRISIYWTSISGPRVAASMSQSRGGHSRSPPRKVEVILVQNPSTRRRIIISWFMEKVSRAWRISLANKSYIIQPPDVLKKHYD